MQLWRKILHCWYSRSWTPKSVVSISNFKNCLKGPKTLIGMHVYHNLPHIRCFTFLTSAETCAWSQEGCPLTGGLTVVNCDFPFSKRQIKMSFEQKLILNLNLNKVWFLLVLWLQEYSTSVRRIASNQRESKNNNFFLINCMKLAGNSNRQALLFCPQTSDMNIFLLGLFDHPNFRPKT